MSFSTDQTVLNIKLTNKGRELLSRGQLTFKKFALGDSEINYDFNDTYSIGNFDAVTFRPVDGNPEIATFVKQTSTSENLNTLPTVVSTTNTITNTVAQRGLFNVTGSTISLYDDPTHVKQPHVAIYLSGVTGGTDVKINTSPAYGTNPTVPVVGDYLMVKWNNPYYTGNTDSFDVTDAIPYLFYKIVSITTPTGLTTGDFNNWVIELDRDLPNYSGFTGSTYAGAIIYPNNNNRFVSGDSVQNFYGAPFSTNFLESFYENYIPIGNTVEVWNMTIVFTRDIIGIDPDVDRNVGGNPSRFFNGLVNYVQRVNPTVENIGIIHYSNNSPFNDYGEGLVASNSSVPIIDLPTIMWDKNTGGTIGMRLTADFASGDNLPDLDTPYFNLVDQFDNVVGKVFTELKIFIIEDQELLMAMSYKSNRSWTLPAISTSFNGQQCVTSDLEVSGYAATTTTTTTTTIPPTTGA